MIKELYDKFCLNNSKKLIVTDIRGVVETPNISEADGFLLGKAVDSKSNIQFILSLPNIKNRLFMIGKYTNNKVFDFVVLQALQSIKNGESFIMFDYKFEAYSILKDILKAYNYEIIKDVFVDKLDEKLITNKCACFIKTPTYNEKTSNETCTRLVQIIENLIRILPYSKFKDKMVNVFMYEIETFGKINDLSKLICLSKFTNINYVFIVRSIKQFEYVYGKEQTKILLSLCNALIFTDEIDNQIKSLLDSYPWNMHRLTNNLSKDELCYMIMGGSPYVTKRINYTEHPIFKMKKS